MFGLGLVRRVLRSNERLAGVRDATGTVTRLCDDSALYHTLLLRRLLQSPPVSPPTKRSEAFGNNRTNVIKAKVCMCVAVNIFYPGKTQQNFTKTKPQEPVRRIWDSIKYIVIVSTRLTAFTLQPKNHNLQQRIT